MIPGITYWPGLSAAEQAELLRRPALRSGGELESGVAEILAAIRAGGDAALAELSIRFDGVSSPTLRVTESEFADARDRLSTAETEAIDLAIGNVRQFHEAQLPVPVSMETTPGVRCERLSHPLESVGLYVPAGSAPLPSTAIMLGVPAGLANCPVRIMCTPPRRDGNADPAILVAAERCGIRDVFKVGGAQAIAAMACGTETVPRVNKIFGPGNAWVTEAKRVVSQSDLGVAIDMQAGPSEALVIADDSANAAFVAADLLSQAEHGADSQVLLVTTCDALARQVGGELARQLADLPRAEIAAKSLENCRLIVADSLAEAILISNRYAPEHLLVQTRHPRQLLESIRNAGSVFLGSWSPEAAGDYCSGTNHVLPTYGLAASHSGLSVRDFMRDMTVQELTRSGLQTLAPAIRALAELEGLDAHANAVRIRLCRDVA